MKNDTIYGFITVRTSSTRLPKKCLMPFGKKRVLDHIINRCLAFNIEPIVCTSTHESDNVIYDIAIENNVKCFRGSLVNKLKRWADCAVKFNVNYFHTIDADDPFFDGEEVQLSMNKLINDGFDVVTPTDSSSNGGGSVGYSLKSSIVIKAVKNLDTNTDTEMMWAFLEKINNIKINNLEENFDRPKKLRLTLDFYEDYVLLKFIVDLLGTETPRSSVDQIFFRNPDLYKLNWFRNSEWKQSQNNKIENYKI